MVLPNYHRCNEEETGLRPAQHNSTYATTLSYDFGLALCSNGDSASKTVAKSVTSTRLGMQSKSLRNDDVRYSKRRHMFLTL